MLHGKENELSYQLHNAGDLRVPRINYRYYRLVIAPELKAFPSKKWVPNGAGDNIRKEFLPFNTNPLFPVQAHVGRPVTLKPETSDPVELYFLPHSLGLEILLALLGCCWGQLATTWALEWQWRHTCG